MYVSIFYPFIDPFQVRILSTKRNGFILVFGVLIFSCICATPAFVNAQVYTNNAYKSGKSCLVRNDEKARVWLQNIVTTNAAMLYPLAILTVLTGILVVKLHKISKASRRLAVRPSPRSTARKKELHAAITMVFLGAIECAFYIPSGILWSIYFAFPLFKSEPVELFYGIAGIARTTISLTIICHFYNFYLYMFRIPAFRQDFFQLIKCKGFKKRARSINRFVYSHESSALIDRSAAP